MAGGIAALGSYIQVDDGAGNYTTVANVVKFSGPGGKTNDIDTSHLLSANQVEEFVAGMKKSSEVKFTVLFNPAETTHTGANGLLTLWKNRTTRNFKVILSDVGATTWTVSCTVMEWELVDIDTKSALGMDITLGIHGQPSGTGF